MSILNFADLKKGGQAEIDRLNEEASKLKSKSFQKDERYWQPELDKGGEGSAVIRFLPAPAGEMVPFVRKFSYGFKGPGGRWFIENSPSTLDLPCPVMEMNSALWETGTEENKDLARSRKRRLGFITNIYVVKHKARPADEGKVFLYEFGKKIWDKLNDKMSPDDEDKKPMNPFDLWTGANFRLKIAQVAGFRNYDKSEFDEIGPLSASDEEMKAIWEQTHSLSAEIAPDKFLSYDELKRKLDSILGAAPRQASAPEKDESAGDDSLPWKESGAKDEDIDWLKDLAKG